MFIRLIIMYNHSSYHLPPLQVHVPNDCESGTRVDVEEPEADEVVVPKDPEELKKDPHTCFFENQHHAHGSRWTPNYDRCFSCSCQVKTKQRERQKTFKLATFSSHLHFLDFFPPLP